MKMITPQNEYLRWMVENKRGLLAVFGAFLIQLCEGMSSCHLSHKIITKEYINHFF